MESYMDKIIGYVENGDFSQLLDFGNGSFINGEVAREIYQSIMSSRTWVDHLSEISNEQQDFIRLLRKENKELRGEGK